ncbi:Leucine rich repeat protein [Entamoeba marina]
MKATSIINNKKLDSYSILICAKYFNSFKDYMNIICVCKKFKETTEKLRFNPISISSKKLFPKIQTQYLYDKSDIKISGIDTYEAWYKVSYEECLRYKEDNIKFHYVIYSHENRLKHGDDIPDSVTILGESCFGRKIWLINDASNIKEINIPSTITSLDKYCFNDCISLRSINLPSTLTSLGVGCFSNCKSLTTITLPSTLQSLGKSCFSCCSSLLSINLPSTLTSLGYECFLKCESLQINDSLDTIAVFEMGCFYGCYQLKGEIDVPRHCFKDPNYDYESDNSSSEHSTDIF